MNKTEFINFVAEKNEITKVSAREMVDVVLDSIVAGMKEDGVVNLTGFGKFEIKDVEARERRNPSTGEVFMADAHATPKFKFAQNVKADIR